MAPSVALTLRREEIVTAERDDYRVAVTVACGAAGGKAVGCAKLADGVKDVGAASDVSDGNDVARGIVRQRRHTI